MKYTDNISILMQELLDSCTKPVGSLGDLEALALRMAGIQGKVPPSVEKKLVIVCAGDHGITAEGVSLYPREVTAQMVQNISGGGAAINVLARALGYDVWVVDCGVYNGAFDVPVHSLRAGNGTENFYHTPAMTEEQRAFCEAGGRALAEQAAAQGYDIIALGDMGIGNTSSAAALLCAAGFSPEEVVDRGTGISDAALEAKRRIIAEAVCRHGPYAGPREMMSRLGGFELATLAGICLGLKGRNVACVMDGFPVSAAVYMAFREDPAVAVHVFAGHRSKVKGHGVILEAMRLCPIVDLSMRLGEGTGAVIGGHMIELGVKLSREMARFENAGVSRSIDDEKNY